MIRRTSKTAAPPRQAAQPRPAYARPRRGVDSFEMVTARCQRIPTSATKKDADRVINDLVENQPRGYDPSAFNSARGAAYKFVKEELGPRSWMGRLVERMRI